METIRSDMVVLTVGPRTCSNGTDEDDTSSTSSVHKPLFITTSTSPSSSPSTTPSSVLLVPWPKQWTFLLTLLFVFFGSYCLVPLVYRGTVRYWSTVVRVVDADDRPVLRPMSDCSAILPNDVAAASDSKGIERVAVADDEDDDGSNNSLEPSSSTKRRIRFPRTKRRLPQCIIIGVRKCGTRALLEFLNVHPRIVKATQEVHFFDDDSRYSLGLEWYRRRMPYSFADQITVEKSPSYFVTRHVPERIAAMNRNARLLLIVREPVIRAVSDYAQIAANRAAKQSMSSSPSSSTITTTTTTGEWVPRRRPEAVGLSHPVRRWRSTPSFESLAIDERTGDVNADYRALQISVYADHLRPWLNVFPREQIHVIDGDRLVVDPLAELRLIEDFLGLEQRITADNFYFNRTKGFYCVRNDTAEKCLSGAKGRPHPSVPAHVVGKLRRYFTPHNQRFFDMIGRNFSWAVMATAAFQDASAAAAFLPLMPSSSSNSTSAAALNETA